MYLQGAKRQEAGDRDREGVEGVSQSESEDSDGNRTRAESLEVNESRVKFTRDESIGPLPAIGGIGHVVKPRVSTCISGHTPLMYVSGLIPAMEYVHVRMRSVAHHTPQRLP